MINKLITRYLISIYCLIIILNIGLLVKLTYHDNAYHIYNIFNPLGNFIILGYLSYSIFRLSPEMVWSPFVFIPLQCSIFFGFGPLSEVFGSDDTTNFLLNYFIRSSSSEIASANILSTVGTSGVLLGMCIYTYIKRETFTNFVKINKNGLSIKNNSNNLVLIIVLIGFLLKYLYIIPALHRGDIAIGIISRAGLIVDAGFSMLAYFIAKKRASAINKLIFYTLLPIHITLSLLSFSKELVIISILFPILGYYLGKNNIYFLLKGVVVIFIIYISLQPLISYGRYEIYTDTGSINKASFHERFEITKRYILSEEINKDLSIENRQSWWLRFSFVRQQTLAMKLYESGSGINTLGNLAYLFVPRVIWPDKPILYAPGLIFYATATQNDGTSFLPATLYGDLFMQGGWLVLTIGSVIVGYIFGYLSQLTLLIYKSDKIILFPIILMIVELSMTSLTKFLINGVISPIIMILVYYTVIQLFIYRGR